MSEAIWNCVETLLHLGAALGLVLAGWRLGRESAGRPMFAFGVRPSVEAETREEPDPWSAAMAGPLSGGDRSGEVDIFETLADPFGQKDGRTAGRM